MRYVRATIMLGFSFMILLIITGIYSLTMDQLSPVLTDAYTDMGIAGHSHWVNTLETIGWVICALFGAATIATYLIGTQSEEYERYEYGNYGNRYRR